MVQAIGYVIEQFDPAVPGRLVVAASAGLSTKQWVLWTNVQACIASSCPERPSPMIGQEMPAEALVGPVDMWNLVKTTLGDGMLIACAKVIPRDAGKAANIENHTVARPGGSTRMARALAC